MIINQVRDIFSLDSEIYSTFKKDHFAVTNMKKSVPVLSLSLLSAN